MTYTKRPKKHGRAKKLKNKRDRSKPYNRQGRN